MRFVWLTLALSLMMAVSPAQESNDIVAKLLPDHNPLHLAKVTVTERSKTIEQLKEAQKHATGTRSQQIAFLLATLDSDYEKNLDYLIHVLHGCTTPSVKWDCDENTGDFLIALYRRGHKEVLKPLMLVGKDSYNAMLAELLGDFYSNVIAEHPTEFLDTIRPLTAKAQKRLCSLSGAGDGSGMAPKNLRQVRRELRSLGDDVALTCLRAIDTANKAE
jgi:hypothetical protein